MEEDGDEKEENINNLKERSKTFENIYQQELGRHKVLLVYDSTRLCGWGK